MAIITSSSLVNSISNERTEIEVHFAGTNIESNGYEVLIRVYDSDKNIRSEIKKPFGHDRLEAFREFRRLVSNAVMYIG